MTALARAYTRDPAKPVWIQEFGATPEWMPAEAIPEFLGATVRRAARAGARWFTWWSRSRTQGLSPTRPRSR